MEQIKILYEDKNLVVINKPAGLIVHGDGKTAEPSVADWVLDNYPKTKNVGEPIVLQNGQKIFRPGIVHRLDKETSGALVVAKNQKTFEFLKKQFQDRQVEKVYRAFVYGKVKDDEGIIDRPIGKSRSDFRKRSAQRGAKGEMREAVTEYKTLARGGAGDNGFSFLELRPKTGRTHQIRVHLKAINYPVVCDSLYAPRLVRRSLGEVGRAPILGFNRLALHAKSISFNLPNGKKIAVEAPLPADFENALKSFDNFPQ